MFLGRKVVAKLASILKSRHHFADKGPSSQNYGFSSNHVWMWEWTIKKAEHQRIDAFKLWCWRNSWVPWTARRPNQSTLKEISPEYSLEGLILKLKLQYCGYLIVKSWITGKKPNSGKGWGQKEKGATKKEMVGWSHWLNASEFAQTPEDSEGQRMLSMESQWVRHDWVTEQQQIILYLKFANINFPMYFSVCNVRNLLLNVMKHFI